MKVKIRDTSRIEIPQFEITTNVFPDQNCSESTGKDILVNFNIRLRNSEKAPSILSGNRKRLYIDA